MCQSLLGGKEEGSQGDSWDPMWLSETLTLPVVEIIALTEV